MHLYKKSTYIEQYTIQDFPISVPKHGWIFPEIKMKSLDKLASLTVSIDCLLRVSKLVGSEMLDFLVIDNG